MPSTIIKQGFFGRYLYIGMAFALSYWAFDAALMVLVFKEGGWLEQLFRPGSDEVYMRAFTGLVFIVSGGAINRLLKRQQEILRQQGDAGRIIEDSLNEIYIFDAETLKFVLVNRGARENLGYRMAELADLTAIGIKPEVSEAEFRSIIKPLLTGEQKISVFNTVHRRKNGTDYPVEVHLQLTSFEGKPAFAAIILDTSERDRVAEEKRTIETQMLNGQKLESLGVLAGGIAHDFNNLLTVILGNADLLRTQTTHSPSEEKNFQAIVSAAQQAADLCNQLLAYSGRGRFFIEPVNLSTLVEEMTGLLQVSIAKNVALTVQRSESAPIVEGDVSQLRQILMNLITNASEAIGTNSGVVSLTTGVKACDLDYLNRGYADDHLPAGRYAFIEVTDTGEGMDEATIKKIFDPFFTSKFTGRGLGLAAIMGITRGHKGRIQVYSEPGKGTRFKLLLPAVSQTTVARTAVGEVDEQWLGSGRALVVDDDPLVREIAIQLMEKCGFEVVVAVDGKQGVELFQQYADELSVVLLDLTMPEMNGAAAFEKMHQIDSAVPVILTSGFNEQEVASQFVGKGLAGFIPKPYRVDNFITTVRDAVTS